MKKNTWRLVLKYKVSKIEIDEFGYCLLDLRPNAGETKKAVFAFKTKKSADAAYRKAPKKFKIKNNFPILEKAYT